MLPYLEPKKLYTKDYSLGCKKCPYKKKCEKLYNALEDACDIKSLVANVDGNINELKMTLWMLIKQVKKYKFQYPYVEYQHACHYRIKPRKIDFYTREILCVYNQILDNLMLEKHHVVSMTATGTASKISNNIKRNSLF